LISETCLYLNNRCNLTQTRKTNGRDSEVMGLRMNPVGLRAHRTGMDYLACRNNKWRELCVFE